MSNILIPLSAMAVAMAGDPSNIFRNVRLDLALVVRHTSSTSYSGLLSRISFLMVARSFSAILFGN